MLEEIFSRKEFNERERSEEIFFDLIRRVQGHLETYKQVLMGSGTGDGDGLLMLSIKIEGKLRELESKKDTMSQKEFEMELDDIVEIKKGFLDIVFKERVLEKEIDFLLGQAFDLRFNAFLDGPPDWLVEEDQRKWLEIQEHKKSTEDYEDYNDMETKIDLLLGRIKTRYEDKYNNHRSSEIQKLKDSFQISSNVKKMHEQNKRVRKVFEKAENLERNVKANELLEHLNSLKSEYEKKRDLYVEYNNSVSRFFFSMCKIVRNYVFGDPKIHHAEKVEEIDGLIKDFEQDMKIFFDDVGDEIQEKHMDKEKYQQFKEKKIERFDRKMEDLREEIELIEDDLKHYSFVESKSGMGRSS